MKYSSIFRKRAREADRSPSPSPSPPPPTSHHQPQRSLLLSLPPELRNEIFALAVTSVDPVTTIREEPPLLRASKQTRTEARPLYYFSNNAFHITILDCDATTLVAFWKTVLDLQAQYPGAKEKPVALTIDLVGRPDWRNLMLWGRYVFEHRQTALLFDADGEGDPYTAVVSAVLGIAAECECGKWEGVQMALRYFRVLAGEVDMRWLID